MTMIELIEQIRNNSSTMLGYKSADRLYVFLQGFAFARKGTVEGNNDYRMLADFGKWVRNRFRITSTQDWGQVIVFFAASPSNSLDLFFDLYEEFRQQKHRLSKHKTSDEQFGLEEASDDF